MLKKIKNKKLFICLVLWYCLFWAWSLQTDSVELAGSKTQGFILALIVTIINVLLSSTIMYKGFRFVGKYIQSKNKLKIALVFPLMAFVDYLVAVVPATFWVGPQGRLGSILPIGSPTILIVNTPIKYATRIIGFFGLAGFFWGICLLLSIKGRRKYALVAMLTLVSLTIVGRVGYSTTNGTNVKAKIISEKLSDRVDQVKVKDTDFVIFPEYGLDRIDNKSLHTRIERTSKSQPKTAFLGTEQIFIKDEVGHLNTIDYGNTRDGIVYKTDKYRLIPGGEDLPYAVRVLLRATGQVGTLNYFSFAKGTLKGQKKVEPYSIDSNTSIGAAPCSSIIAPQDYRYFVSRGATVLSNSASLTTFKGSSLFAWEQKSLAKFMAVSNSRYFLQSANSATAYAIDNNGSVITEQSGKKVIDVQVKNNLRKTPYTIFSDWLVIVGWFAVFILVISKLNKNRINTKKTKSKNKTII